VSAGYDAMRGGAGLVEVDRGLVLVTGPDTVSYLQSLVSADLDPVGDGDGAHSLLLTPQGKLEADFRLLRVDDDCWLDADAGFGPRLTEALLRFKIRVKVDVEDRSGTWGVLAVKGPDAAAAVESAAGIEVPTAPHAHAPWGDARVVRADWPGLRGVDVVGPRAELARHRDALLAASAVAASDVDYEAARVEAGVPRQSLDLDDRTIPQEAFLEVDAVSFTKGCFLGQELVTRIDTRGHVNRHLRGVRLAAIAEPGAEVESDGKSVGQLTSVAESPANGPIALAMVRREVEPPAEVTVAGRPATVETLPLVP
jgi:tRNA-modifying protein YgfZ